MTLIETLAGIVGAANVLTGKDTASYDHDWLGNYVAEPMCVVRPASTVEVSAILAATYAAGVPVVPVSGNTGLNGATHAPGQVMLSLERMNRIREIRPKARIAIVEAGVVLAKLHEAVEAEGLVFPLFFGARGSCMIGGNLSTNAGGSNVLRYGNTRALTLGIEVVLPDGEVMNLMSELHKDNSGYDLKDLFIGAEGTLGVITAAVVKLSPKPRAYATAMIALDTLGPALTLLNRLQEATGGAVEGFEYMPQGYMAALAKIRPDLKAPLGHDHPVTILAEVGATAPKDAMADDEGRVPVADLLETELGRLAEEGLIKDAVVAGSEAQRRAMWALRESAAEVSHAYQPTVENDVCLPLDRVEEFLDVAGRRLAEMDPGAFLIGVGHLGDGNIHYSIKSTVDDPAARDAIREMVEDVVKAFGGSFSAEHGIGLTKLPSMRRRKDPVALAVMRRIKQALDPKGLMNPGKVLPEEPTG